MNGERLNRGRADIDEVAPDPVSVVRSLNGMLDGVDVRALRDELENADSVRDLRGGDFAWMVDLVEAVIAPGFRLEWVAPTAPMLQGSEFEGRDEWMRLWRDWLAAWDEYELVHRDYVRFGDQVVCDLVHRGRGRGSGIEAEITQSVLWTIRDGRGARARMYETREDAVDVARAEEEGEE